MTKTQPILVPVDFTSTSGKALDLAMELAGAFTCPVLVLHVVHDSGDAPGQYAQMGLARTLSPMENVARENLDGFLATRVQPSSNGERTTMPRAVLVQGVPAGRILEVAQREDAAMIVMGSHGRRGLTRAMMGSVAEEVSRSSTIPVTIVKEDGTTLDIPRGTSRSA